MTLILLGLLWFSVALLSTYFIVISGRNTMRMVKAGIALILFSFIAGLVILFAAIVM